MHSTGVPSPSPPPVASEFINKYPLDAVVEAKGERTDTGIVAGSISILQSRGGIEVFAKLHVLISEQSSDHITVGGALAIELETTEFIDLDIVL